MYNDGIFWGLLVAVVGIILLIKFYREIFGCIGGVFAFGIIITIAIFIGRFLYTFVFNGLMGFSPILSGILSVVSVIGIGVVIWIIIDNIGGGSSGGGGYSSDYDTGSRCY